MKFTVLTAIRNGFADFRKAAPTVLAQTYADFEWIIVDDASDEPLSTAFPELARDPRVKIHRLDGGAGQTRALNYGIREARGDWIVRMDGDDLCAPDRLARIREALEQRPEAQLLFSDYFVIDETDRVWAEVRMQNPLPGGFFSYLDKRNNPLCHPTVAFRRSGTDGKPRQFREDLVNAQDYALWKEILHQSGESAFVHLPFPSVSYRIVRDSLSGARAREQEVEKRAIRDGQTLRHGEQERPLLSTREKDAMQSYRILYYRFVGRARPARISEELSLLQRTFGFAFARALCYWALRPLRRALLSVLFAGIYA